MKKRGQNGFTLIEVLVAVVVLGIGLTGMAGLQIVSMRSAHQADQRTQATLLAYDILDRMRANVGAAQAGEYDTGMTDDVSALALCFGTAADCSPAELADHDRRQWRQTLNGHLSDGLGSIATATVAGQTQATIIVQWVDADAGVDGNGVVVPQQLSIAVNL